jgi:hypothetical protein
VRDPIPPQWPADLVRVSYTARGVRLHFPASRRWRLALRLGGIGMVLFLPSLYAAIAFAPASKSDAGAMLALALTAAVVYPVLAFGALFVLVALHAAASTLTVDVDANSISAARHCFGLPCSGRTLPVAQIAELKAEPAVAPRGLGGRGYYRLVAVPGQSSAGKKPAARLTVADGIPDETLLEALKALIARYARLDCKRPEQAGQR